MSTQRLLTPVLFEFRELTPWLLQGADVFNQMRFMTRCGIFLNDAILNWFVDNWLDLRIGFKGGFLCLQFLYSLESLFQSLLFLPINNPPAGWLSNILQNTHWSFHAQLYWKCIICQATSVSPDSVFLSVSGVNGKGEKKGGVKTPYLSNQSSLCTSGVCANALDDGAFSGPSLQSASPFRGWY